MAEAEPTEPPQLPRYRVEIPFHSATNGRLANLPFELPDGTVVDRQIRPDDRPENERPTTLSTTTKSFSPQGAPLDIERPPITLGEPLEGDYRYCITLRAASAEEAICCAEAKAKDLLAAIAARQMAFEVGPPGRRFFKRLDPPTEPVPDTELPFDTVNIRNTDPAMLAARYDPTGKRRREGMIFSSVADSAVYRDSLEIDAELYAGQDSWHNRTRRAAEVYRLALCSRDEVVRFLLSCLALEVLVDHDSVAIVSTRFATKPERDRVVDAVNRALEEAGLAEQDRDRIITRVRQTEVLSYTTSAASYLNDLDLSMPAENLVWVQRQRGRFVHSGEFEDSRDAALRRNDFAKIVGVVLQREMARAAGRSFTGLDMPITFSWLEVWFSEQDEPTLRPH